MPQNRVTTLLTEGYSLGLASLRVPTVLTEGLTSGFPAAKVTTVATEGYSEGYPTVRISMVVVEAFCPVDPEEVMSTEPFPGFGNSASNPAIPSGADPFNSALPGLAFSVHKKPTFKTRISESASGFEVRNALMAYPKWDFELTYEFLEDSSGAESSLKTILGFFLARQGAYDSWLFKDPDDYLCVNSTCGTPDGVTTTFYFCREMTGGFLERVGQVDLANTVTLYLTVTETHLIPVTPGPYTINPHGGALIDGGVTKVIGGAAMTKVASAPANNQYSVDETTGVYTFNSANQNTSVEITFRYVVPSGDYDITLPNLITFDSAPPEGTLSADFQFFFVCRFLEDQMDFEKFADKLWNLQQCDFRSLIQ